jgi:hypothetical protein
MTLVHALLALASATFDPRAAAYVAATVLGRPDIAPALVRVCRRESLCQPIGVHPGDAGRSLASWRSQVGLGHLDPRGLNAADHWQYLPRCYAPAVLDVPLVSAFVAARKYLRRCDGERARGWCPSPSRSSS